MVIADITCNDSAYYLVVSSNPVDGEVYSMQHYIIKFVSDLQQVGGFHRVLCSSSPIKLTATNCQHSWIIVESDFKHHKPYKLLGLSKQGTKVLYLGTPTVYKLFHIS